MTPSIPASAEVKRAQFGEALEALHEIAQWIDTEEGETFRYLTRSGERPPAHAAWRAAKYVLAHPGSRTDSGNAQLATPGSVELHGAIVQLIETAEFHLFSAWERVTGGSIDHPEPVNTSSQLLLSEMAELRAKVRGITQALEAIELEAAS